MLIKFKRSIVKGISFPESIWNIIDKDRKDVNRSKFLLRLVEKAYSYGSFDESGKTNIK
jgi:hypothetical protein